MSEPTVRLVRSGRSPVITADNVLVMGDGPDIYAHVQRAGFVSWHWEITAGRDGEPLAWGWTWTSGGAWVEAIAAAHRPGITDGGAR